MTVELDNPRVPKLAQYCLNSLVKAPTDNEQLYKLSTDELVELNRKLLKDYQSVEGELRQLRRYRYPVEPPRVQKRVAGNMHERVARITGAWQPVPVAEVQALEMVTLSDSQTRSHRGKQAICIVWEEATAQVVYQIHAGRVQDWEKLLAYKAIISSALLLYRLCCLFKCDVKGRGPDGYKIVWSTYVKHRTTNTYVGFAEWKASPMFLTSNYPPTGTAFDEDWLALLNLLFDPRCPHPYDGTVAGSVA